MGTLAPPPEIFVAICDGEMDRFTQEKVSWSAARLIDSEAVEDIGQQMNADRSREEAQ